MITAALVLHEPMARELLTVATGMAHDARHCGHQQAAREWTDLEGQLRHQLRLWPTEAR